MLKQLKNENLKLVRQTEIVIISACLIAVSFVLVIIYTCNYRDNSSKSLINLDYDDIENQIVICQRKLSLLDSQSDEYVKTKQAIERYNLLITENVQSDASWKYIISEIAVQGGFFDDAVLKIRNDDYKYFYETMIFLSDSQFEREKMNVLLKNDVYPDISDFRYVLSLEMSESNEENDVLLYRIEQGIPLKDKSGSFGIYLNMMLIVIRLVCLQMFAIIASCVIGEEQKVCVAHESVRIIGKSKSAKVKIVFLVVLTMVIFVTYVLGGLALGRLLFDGTPIPQIEKDNFGNVVETPCYNIALKSFAISIALSFAVEILSGLLVKYSKSEIIGIAFGSVVTISILANFLK